MSRRRACRLATLPVLICLSATTPTLAEPIELAQADGSSLFLETAAQRLVTLAPHLAELVYAAGAGDLLLATVEYSDTPQEAAELPRIGDAFRFDLERIIALRPDLVLVWHSGNPAPAQAALDQLGLQTWKTEIRRPAEMAEVIAAIGRATGRVATARSAAAAVRRDLERLRATYADRAPVSYFYQVAPQPLYTVNGDHLISQGLALCGGVNVFAELPMLAPQVAQESVIVADPDALIAPRVNASDMPLEAWRAWPNLRAVDRNALVYLAADRISRATPRMLASIDEACARLDELRRRN